jgi:hypothetical protein
VDWTAQPVKTAVAQSAAKKTFIVSPIRSDYCKTVERFILTARNGNKRNFLLEGLLDEDIAPSEREPVSGNRPLVAGRQFLAKP